MTERPRRDQATVLVIEDEVDLASLYETWLSERHEVIVANDGESGLESMSDDVDVVLLDRRMPGMTGDEVLHEIKAEEYRCFVVMVTAVDADVDIVDLPLDDYVTKPLTKYTMLDIVDRMLRIRHAGPDVREFHSLERRRDVLRTARTQRGITDQSAFSDLTKRLEAAAAAAGPGLVRLEDDYYETTIKND